MTCYSASSLRKTEAAGIVVKFAQIVKKTFQFLVLLYQKFTITNIIIHNTHTLIFELSYY